MDIRRFHKNQLTEDDSEDLKRLMQENQKLRHRLAILNAAIDAEKNELLVKRGGQKLEPMMSVLNHLNDVFNEALKDAFPEYVSAGHVAIITEISHPKFGDYQCNNSLAINKFLKERNISKPPMEIANAILERVKPSPIIAKVNIAGIGFLNVFLDKSYVSDSISSILRDGLKPPKMAKRRALVDFSSPNIAKQMHVGHLRSTIIGESICRLLEFLGHDVIRINHVGDWGTQFGMLIAHLEDQFPNYRTQSPPIDDLQKFYKESKERFDNDEAFKKRAYASVVKLQGGDEHSLKAWNLICDVSRREFQAIYDRLDVSIVERGESFYQSRMEAIVRDLKAKQLLEEDEGRLIMWGQTRDTGIPLTVVKSDGGFTYDTSDMAAIKQRLEEEKADWLIYVTDSGQATHFHTIFDCATRLGVLDRKRHRVDHACFGVVLGEDGKKFKTRSGDTVKLAELLDEGVRRAEQKLQEKNRGQSMTREEMDAARDSIAYGCIKYADLSHNRNHEYTFSFDKMLDDKGNTAVYLLYAFARIKSIARNCGAEFLQAYPEHIRTERIVLEHEKEWKLAKVLMKYPDMMLRCANDLLFHTLCEFAYEICGAFTEFYDKCYCIKKDKAGQIVEVNVSRVLLAESTATVLQNCFHILGLKPLEKI